MFLPTDAIRLLALANTIDWVNVIVGAFVGVAAASIPAMIRVVRSVLNDQYRNYYGEYFLYNWAVAGGSTISEKKLKISRTFGGYPNVTLHINENVVLIYKGKMRTNRRSLYFDLIGKEHAEELKIIFHEPLEKKINFLAGVFAAITLGSDPLAGKLLISKFRLDCELAKTHLGIRNIIIVGHKPYINIVEGSHNPAKYINNKFS